MVNLRDLIKKFGLDKARPLSAKEQKHRKVHSLIYCAMKSGKIKRPSICHACLRECKPDAHHPDYNRPFLIQWLCKSCHQDTYNCQNRYNWYKLMWKTKYFLGFMNYFSLSGVKTPPILCIIKRDIYNPRKITRLSYRRRVVAKATIIIKVWILMYYLSAFRAKQTRH